jgi:hypothetical protein
VTSSAAALLTQDLTDPELKRTNPACDRTVSVYGYVRGTHFKAHQKVHIPGFGDVFPREVSLLPDPCPLPDKLKKACMRRSCCVWLGHLRTRCFTAA